MRAEIPTKAITIKDPWAQAIVYGDKRIENRKMRLESMLGERVAIHCGKTVDREAWDKLERNMRMPGTVAKYKAEQGRHAPGCIIGSARIIGWCHWDQVADQVEERRADGIWQAAGLRSHRWPWPRKSTAEEFEADGYDIFDGTHEDHYLDPCADPWWQGPVGWLLDFVVAYDPIEARGMPGFWPIPEDVREQLVVVDADH